jgi:hypothetical protein
MLAQKIALETFERRALAVANRCLIVDLQLRGRAGRANAPPPLHMVRLAERDSALRVGAPGRGALICAVPYRLSRWGIKRARQMRSHLGEAFLVNPAS